MVCSSVMTAISLSSRSAISRSFRLLDCERKVASPSS